MPTIDCLSYKLFPVDSGALVKQSKKALTDLMFF